MTLTRVMILTACANRDKKHHDKGASIDAPHFTRTSLLTSANNDSKDVAPASLVQHVESNIP